MVGRAILLLLLIALLRSGNFTAQTNYLGNLTDGARVRKETAK